MSSISRKVIDDFVFDLLRMNIMKTMKLPDDVPQIHGHCFDLTLCFISSIDKNPTGIVPMISAACERYQPGATCGMKVD